VILLANKIDMAKDGFVKSPSQMDQYCKENNFVGWFETSAKENIGIDKAAKFLISKILENKVTERPSDPKVIKAGTKTDSGISEPSEKKDCVC